MSFCSEYVHTCYNFFFLQRILYYIQLNETNKFLISPKDIK